MPEDKTKTPDLGISNNAVSVARMIDRLPAGTFTITLAKNGFTKAPWSVDIHRVEKVREMKLEKE